MIISTAHMKQGQTGTVVRVKAGYGLARRLEAILKKGLPVLLAKLKATGIMVVIALAVGGLLNVIL